MWTEIQNLFQAQFDIKLEKEAYYQEAFTHSSFVYEQHGGKTEPDNERIEFLGDAVIDLIVSDYLYEHYTAEREGQLSRLRAAIVCEESLALRCQECGFHRFVRLGFGEEKNGGRMRPGLLCDLFEAVCGALYLDLGLVGVQKFLEQSLLPLIAQGVFHAHPDPKTHLQEVLQEQYGPAKITYEVLEQTGPSHCRNFVIAVFFNGKQLGAGQGRSKKIAEKHAAQAALAKLEPGLGTEE